MIRERAAATLPGLPVLLVVLIALGVLVLRAHHAGVRRLAGAHDHRGAARRSLFSFPARRALRRQSERRPRAAALRRLRRHGQARRGCAGRTRSTPRSASRFACATSRARKLKVNDLEGNPDRDRRGRRLARRRHRRSGVRGRRLSELREGADRGGACATWRRATRTTRTKRIRCRCAATPPRSPST